MDRPPDALALVSIQTHLGSALYLDKTVLFRENEKVKLIFIAVHV
jgi:hypothetical protein